MSSFVSLYVSIHLIQHCLQKHFFLSGENQLTVNKSISQPHFIHVVICSCAGTSCPYVECQKQWCDRLNLISIFLVPCKFYIQLCQFLQKKDLGFLCWIYMLFQEELSPVQYQDFSNWFFFLSLDLDNLWFSPHCIIFSEFNLSLNI